ncbi:hypothetical protein [Vreelandella sp. TE19]
MNHSLRALMYAALLAVSLPALAGSETSNASETAPSTTDSAQQKRLQDLRAEYEERRDRLTGADKLPARAAQSGSFYDAPVDTRDAPDQASDRSSR